jgi:hypothetical protein
MNDNCGRFFFAKDMNGDLAFTITDVWLFAKSVYLLPAKFVAGLIQDSQIGTFFEVTCATGDGWGGVIFSFIAWLIVLSIIGAILKEMAGLTDNK